MDRGGSKLIVVADFASIAHPPGRINVELGGENESDCGNR
jgi:hypothetical protein